MKFLPPPALDGDFVYRMAMRRERLPRWWLAQRWLEHDGSRDAWVTWRSRQWWRQQPVRMRTSILTKLEAWGLWDVVIENGYYWEDGRIRVDFWNAKRDREARWKREREFRDRLEQRARDSYWNGWRDGRAAFIREALEDLRKQRAAQ